MRRRKDGVRGWSLGGRIKEPEKSAERLGKLFFVGRDKKRDDNPEPTTLQKSQLFAWLLSSPTAVEKNPNRRLVAKLTLLE